MYVHARKPSLVSKLHVKSVKITSVLNIALQLWHDLSLSLPHGWAERGDWIKQSFLKMASMDLSGKIRTLCMPADVNTGDVLLASKGRIGPVKFLCIAEILKVS